MFDLDPKELVKLTDNIDISGDYDDGYLSSVALSLAADLEEPSPSVKEATTSVPQGDTSNAMDVESTFASSKNQDIHSTG